MTTVGQVVHETSAGTRSRFLTTEKGGQRVFTFQYPGPQWGHLHTSRPALSHVHRVASHQCCVTRQLHPLATGNSFHRQNWQFLAITAFGLSWSSSPFLSFYEPELCCPQGKLLRDGGTPEEMGSISKSSAVPVPQQQSL